MRSKIFFLVILFLVSAVGQVLAEETVLPWERSLEADETVLKWVAKEVGRAKAKEKEGDLSRAWEIWLNLQKTRPEVLIEHGPGHWETVAVVAWREMNGLLKNNPDFSENSLAAKRGKEELERLYKDLISDGEVTPYEAFQFSWYAAPYLPTRWGGTLFEKMGDRLLERGDIVHAYAFYKKILDYSSHRAIRQDLSERVSEKIKLLLSRYSEKLEGIQKNSAAEGITLADGTHYRFLVQEDTSIALGMGENMKREIYDFDVPPQHFNSKKYAPLLIRDGDKILLMPQTRKTCLIFDLNGMFLEKKVITKEIASRYDIKSLHGLLFSGDNFALIPKGIFNMGSPPDEKGRSANETLHTVKITKDFYLQRKEMNQIQWYIVMGATPSYFRDEKYCKEDWDEGLQICPKHPVQQVSWGAVQLFIKTLNEMQNEYVYRLPTEAEWEYAARAGTKTPFYFGETISSDRANYNGDYNYTDKAGHKGIYRIQTIEVGSLGHENAWGLFDMHGNVWEWVSDGYDDNYGLTAEQLGQTVEDPQGFFAGPFCVYRGGSWGSLPQNLRSASRFHDSPVTRGDYLGFRVLRTKK